MLWRDLSISYARCAARDMTASANFATYAVELLGAAGRVAARRMFGGYGLYCDGVMFALIADDVLYLKADDVNRLELERVGSAPFTYEAKGRRTIIAYWRAPDEAMESRELMAPWARGALAAALRAKAARPKAKASRHPKARRLKAKAPRLKAQPTRRGSRAGSKR
jgi:DNA transformation protein and related proteins